MGSSLEISSRANPWFRRIREAIDHHDEEIVLEGPRHIRDALERGWEPLAIALSGDAAGLVISAPVLRLSNGLFKSLSDTVRSQGMIGLFSRPVTSPESIFDSDGIVVILDGVQDPGNVGAIVRLSAAFETAGVLLTGQSADPFGPKAIRASAGAILTVPVARSTRETILGLAARFHFPLFAATADGESIAPLPARATIVFGSEGAGVSEELLSAATRLSIPMSPLVESLNVASAAAILLAGSYHERMKHRHERMKYEG